MSTTTEPDIRFIHFRKYKPNGSPSEKGGGTVAYYRVESAGEGSAVYDFYASHVNPKDNFNAAIGRMVSKGRLTNPRTCDQVSTIVIADDANPVEAILKVLGIERPEHAATLTIPVLVSGDEQDAAKEAVEGASEVLEEAAFPGEGR